jgi:zinc transport system substrate-binding protein
MNPGWKRALSWCLLAALCAGSPPLAADAMPVVVSILPQKYFVERLGGDLVEVEVLVGPGQSPVTYEPTPRQLEAVARARLFVRMGVPFERPWISSLAAGSAGLSILDARDGIPLRAAAGGPDDADHGHEHAGEADPHIWLSPPLAKEMARRLRDRLTTLDPQNRHRFEENYHYLAADLDRLDHDIRELTQARQGLHFLVFHAAWGYFADTYGLHQIAVESGGKAPGPKSLGKLVELARSHGIQTLFVERQFGARTARAVADAIGGRVVVVDPLAENYIENLRKTARLLTGS